MKFLNKGTASGVVLLFVLVLNSCSLLVGTDGIDGKPGEILIKYTWVYTPLSLYTEDPSFGQTIYNGRYETAHVGMHYFEYTAWDGSLWYGTYTIYQNQGTLGEPGSFLTDGADGVDGADVWFELALYSTGPDLYDWSFARLVGSSSDSARDREVQKAAGQGQESASISATLPEMKTDSLQTQQRKTLVGKHYTVVLDYGRKF